MGVIVVLKDAYNDTYYTEDMSTKASSFASWRESYFDCEPIGKM